MRKYFFIFSIVFLFINIANSSELDSVARVDDKIITNYDLNNYIDIIKLRFKDIIEPDNNIRREILNGLIEEVLKGQAVKKENINFDEEEFLYFFETNMEKDGLDKNSNKINMNLYKKILKNNFLWNKLIESKIRPGVFVNNSEVNDSIEYLSEEPIKTMYDISQIIMYKTNDNDPKIVIEKFYDEINKKNNFEYIAKHFSHENKEKSGHIGWVDESDINEVIYEAIKELQVKKITKPLYFGDNTSGFYIIIKLNDKKQEKVIKKDDVIRVQYFIYNQKLNLEIKKYLDNLYNSSFIEIYEENL